MPRNYAVYVPYVQWSEVGPTASTAKSGIKKWIRTYGTPPPQPNPESKVTPA